MNNRTIDIIIEFINACYQEKEGDYSITYKKNGRVYSIDNCRYLFNQILRQYRIPDDHYFVSNKAMKKWNELKKVKNEPIEKYFHREVIHLHEKAKLKLYKGANKEPKTDIVNKFIYNDVFHNDHIVPLKTIIQDLYDLKRKNKLTEENVIKVLDKIYICRMLKEEDRQIKHKSKREGKNYKDIIESDYKEANIEIYKK